MIQRLYDKPREVLCGNIIQMAKLDVAPKLAFTLKNPEAVFKVASSAKLN